MALKDENIMGLIESSSKFLNTVLFTGLGINVKDYENFNEMFELKQKLKKEIENKNFKEAEKELLEEIERRRRKDHEILRVAYWFYLKLNSIEKEELEKSDFSKENVYYGIKKIEEYAMGY